MQQETQRNELAKKETTSSLSLPEELQGAWGTEEVTSEDVTIPKLLLMHGQSELVVDGKARGGDLVKSTSHEVIGNKEEPVRVIPFYMNKTWVLNELVGKKYEWRGEEAMTPQNSDQPWEFIMYKGKEYPIDTDQKDVQKNGARWRRDRAYNFYALLVDELNAGKSKLPIRLQFKRTSWKAGKNIASFFAECAMEKIPPAVKEWKISSELIKGEENTYQVFTTSMGDTTNVEHISVCKYWYGEVTKNKDKYKDDTSEEEAVVTETTAAYDEEAMY